MRRELSSEERQKVKFDEPQLLRGRHAQDDDFAFSCFYCGECDDVSETTDGIPLIMQSHKDTVVSLRDSRRGQVCGKTQKDMEA